MDYYQAGDDIYIFGFSRGAYSARVLAAMLYKVGLLSQGNEELLPFAWDIFRRQHSEEGTKLADGFRHTFGRNIPVKFLGVWDTVCSVGWAWSPKHYEYTAYNPAVQIFRHAVSLDERRTYFVQNLWSQHPPDGQDVLEVWFPGVHCDVGGGYDELESGLSKIALQWMAGEARKAGLKLNPAAVSVIIPPISNTEYAAPDALAPKHESLQCWWWIAELIPKNIKDPENHWSPHWIIPCGRHRHVADGANIHSSVCERMKGDPTYKPPNLPSRWVVCGLMCKFLDC